MKSLAERWLTMPVLVVVLLVIYVLCFMFRFGRTIRSYDRRSGTVQGTGKNTSYGANGKR